IRVINKDDGLHAAVRKGGNGPRLRATSDTTFKYGSNAIRFEKDSLRLITAHQPDATYVRVPDAEPTAGALQQYTGTYTSDEIQAAYKVFIENGALVARITPTIVSKLEPTYIDGFMTDGGN